MEVNRHNGICGWMWIFFKIRREGVVKKSVLPYFDSLCSKIKYNYYTALNNGDVDGFHDLRVAIKKMRALFSFVKSINPVFRDKKHLRQFQSLFKAAAGVRDVQVQLEVLDKYEKRLKRDIPEYRIYLKGHERQELKSFGRFAKGFSIKNLDRKGTDVRYALEGYSLFDGLMTVERRCGELINDLSSLTEARNHAEAELHTIWIISKELRYTLETARICLPVWKDRSGIISDLKELHKVLGEWHDDEIALKYIGGFLESPGNGKDRSAIVTDLAESVREDKEKLVWDFEEQWKIMIRKIKSAAAAG